MSEQMTIKEAVDRIREAVEYYDMVHDTGDEVMTKINKDYVWKGYDYLIEYACQPTNKEDK
tara:strand:- start:86 stop:268 length:183 start_codon:yes stop_codon:yes gene_type:complete